VGEGEDEDIKNALKLLGGYIGARRGKRKNISFKTRTRNRTIRRLMCTTQCEERVPSVAKRSDKLGRSGGRGSKSPQKGPAGNRPGA